MPANNEKVNHQTTEVLLIEPHNQYVRVGESPQHRATEMSSRVADACRLMAHRRRHGAHLSEIGGSVNGGRGMLAEFELLMIPVRLTSMGRRGTGLREEWVVAEFNLIEPVEPVTE